MAGGLGEGGNPIHVSTASMHAHIAARLQNATPAKCTSAFTCRLRIIGLICHSPLALCLTQTANSSAFATWGCWMLNASIKLIFDMKCICDGGPGSKQRPGQCVRRRVLQTQDDRGGDRRRQLPHWPSPANPYPSSHYFQRSRSPCTANVFFSVWNLYLHGGISHFVFASGSGVNIWIYYSVYWIHAIHHESRGQSMFHALKKQKHVI